MQIGSVGIDLGKTSFHVVALGDNGKVLLKKKFSQKQLITFTANLQTSLIGMEACSGAHFLGRALRAQGHDVKLIPAQFVKPFVKSNKNDFLDAEAIAEAVDRDNMRFVPIKTDDQLDLQALHRVRRFDRQRGSLPEGTRVCSLDGTGTEATFHRRQGEAVWDQQARQLLSAQDPGAWGSGSGAAIKTRPHRDGHMDNGTGDESTTQRVDRCHGQQAGADRVGGPFNRSELSGCSECDGSITGPHQVLPPRSAVAK
jgi:Transposase